MIKKEDWKKLSADEKNHLLTEKLNRVTGKTRKKILQETVALMREIFPLDGTNVPLTIETRDKALKLIGLIKMIENPALMDKEEYLEYLNGVYTPAIQLVMRLDTLIPGN